MRIWFLAGLVAAGLSVTGEAAAFNDPDWPCQQRKVRHLSVGQVWAGPPVPEDSAAWRDDPAVAGLIGRLAARRTPMDEVETVVDTLAQESEAADRQTKLVALFGGVFQAIDRERARLVDGITRFALKQRGLSDQIDARRLEIEALRAEAAPDDFDALDRIEDMEDQMAWDTRIYQDRQQSLTYVCESPVILEQRIFAIGRLIQSRLEES